MTLPAPTPVSAPRQFTCRAPPTAPRRGGGFTLIEILIVLVIIGVSVALISVNFATPPERALRRTGERLLLAMQAAQSDALITGQSMAMVASGGEYAFVRRDGERQWRVVQTDAPFAPARFDGGAALVQLQINGYPAAAGTPLVFPATGSGVAFALVLEAAGRRIAVLGDTGGAIRLESS